MRPVFLIFSLALGITACASTKFSPSPMKTQFSTLEGLSFDKTTSAELKFLFGEPSKIVPLKSGLSDHEAWIYTDNDTERLSLLVDKKAGVLKSATWTPKDGEELKKKNSALSRFGSSGFVSKQVGWVAQHHFSDDVIYSHPQKGVSIYTSGSSDTVRTITFGTPTQRAPATK